MGVSVVEHCTGARRGIWVSRAMVEVGIDAEDALHDAFISAWCREKSGLNVSFRLTLAHSIAEIKRKNRKINVGLPVALSDASDLVSMMDARRGVRMAQRVLTADEIMLLIDKWDASDKRTMASIRFARRKLRREGIGLE